MPSSTVTCLPLKVGTLKPRNGSYRFRVKESDTSGRTSRQGSPRPAAGAAPVRAVASEAGASSESRSIVAPTATSRRATTATTPTAARSRIPRLARSRLGRSLVGERTVVERPAGSLGLGTPERLRVPGSIERIVAYQPQHEPDRGEDQQLDRPHQDRGQDPSGATLDRPLHAPDPVRHGGKAPGRRGRHERDRHQDRRRHAVPEPPEHDHHTEHDQAAPDHGAATRPLGCRRISPATSRVACRRQPARAARQPQGHQLDSPGRPNGARAKPSWPRARYKGQRARGGAGADCRSVRSGAWGGW